GAAEAGQDSDDDAKENAHEHQEQVERRQNDGEALHKRGDFFQRTISSLSFPSRILETLLARNVRIRCGFWYTIYPRSSDAQSRIRCFQVCCFLMTVEFDMTIEL